MEFTVKLTAEPKLLAVLETIAAAITGQQAPATNGKVIKAAPAKETAPVSTTTTDAPEASVKGEPIGLEKIRELVTVKSREGHKDKIKALLGEFGAANVSSLQKDQCQAFYEKVNAL